MTQVMIGNVLSTAEARVLQGLPDRDELVESDIASSALDAYAKGVIMAKDLAPNVMATLHERFPSNADPPLDTRESICRHKIIRGIANALLIDVLANEL